MPKKVGFLPVFENGFGQQKVSIPKGFRALCLFSYFFSLFIREKNNKNIYKWRKKVGIWTADTISEKSGFWAHFSLYFFSRLCYTENVIKYRFWRSQKCERLG